MTMWSYKSATEAVQGYGPDRTDNTIIERKVCDIINKELRNLGIGRNKNKGVI